LQPLSIDHNPWVHTSLLDYWLTMNLALYYFHLQALAISKLVGGKFHDQGDAKWIVIRGQLWGDDDTSCGQRARGWPIDRPGSGHPQGLFGDFSYYLFSKN